MFDVLNDIYATLDGYAQEVYGRLGLHPTGGPFTPEVVTVLGGLQALHHMDALVHAHLAEKVGPDTWRLHALARSHAHHTCALDETERARVRTRLVEHYRRQAYQARAAINPWSWSPVPDQVPDQAAVFSGAEEATRWMRDHQHTLVEVARLAHQLGAHTQAWHLADAVKPYLAGHQPAQMWRDIGELALDSAHALGDERAIAYTRLMLGNLDLSLGHHHSARARLDQALEAWQHLGDDQGHATTLEVIATSYLAVEDDLAKAEDLFARSAEIHERIGNPRGAAIQRRKQGSAIRKQERPTEAVPVLQHALNVFTDWEDLYQIVRCHQEMARAHLAAGAIERARDHAAQMSARTRQVPSPVLAVESYLVAADMAQAAGEDQREHLAQALQVCHRHPLPHQPTIEHRLDALTMGGN